MVNYFAHPPPLWVNHPHQPIGYWQPVTVPVPYPGYYYWFNNHWVYQIVMQPVQPAVPVPAPEQVDPPVSVQILVSQTSVSKQDNPEVTDTICVNRDGHVVVSSRENVVAAINDVVSGKIAPEQIPSNSRPSQKRALLPVSGQRRTDLDLGFCIKSSSGRKAEDRVKGYLKCPTCAATLHAVPGTLPWRDFNCAGCRKDYEFKFVHTHF